MAICKQYMAALSRKFCSSKDVDAIALLAQITTVKLMRLRFEKPYTSFRVTNEKGKQRLIEAPEDELKKVLKTISNYLQCAYFFCKTPAAYGFIQQPRNSLKKRNILSNAQLHCGQPFLLNIDLKDFFHQVTILRVTNIFLSPPFNFNIELSKFLAELTTYKNRLPMGSPTSPILSNFATIEMDKELVKMAQQQSLNYSRFVDDLTFSSKNAIQSSHFYWIYHIITEKGYRINQDKLTWMGKHDEKVVTGLILKDKPQVSINYINELKSDLLKLKHVLEFIDDGRKSETNERLEELDKYLLGKLHFLKKINGSDDRTVKKMYSLYYCAYDTRLYNHHSIRCYNTYYL